MEPAGMAGAVPSTLPGPVRRALLAPLVDHHCHGVRGGALSRAAYERLIAGAGTPPAPGTTHFDTPAGTAVRRWCAPVLGLEPHAPPAVYLARRAELGAEEVNRRLLRAAGVVAFLVDPAEAPDETLSAAEMGRLGGAAADEILSLETVEEEVAREDPAAAGYARALEERLAALAGGAVALKSAVPGRRGLAFDPARPARAAVVAAAGRRLAAPKEPLDDPVLLRHLLWTAAAVAREHGLPLQIHTGYGAPGDQGRDRGYGGRDPALAAGLAEALHPAGVPLILLNCHPYHRGAAHLAAVFPHVYLDLAPPGPAASPASAVGELLDLVPYHKMLFGSHGRGLAESCHLGALHFRRALARALAARLERGEWDAAGAARVAHMIGSDNARRVYRL
ncbi:amidohydrolase [Sphaerisporangium krabiense]|uniref:Amidohydrolase-related domain-containing protein n=1 Tax=Sphaerisporangium krabiense TaxID=763782 RepID=A0A7W8ZC49_9ACTN|nr:amidohydrolase family protein [Sphaerisporangium krabiense]MBB5631323.1 hypothetical protein [Sphaerisporangium krabiense]GII60740.1 amidohydrolase [Sphaerisporangium krabiense]